MTSLSISAPESAPPDSWIALAARRGSFYHDPRWVTTLGKCFRYPLTCLTATRAETVVGALALAAVPGILGGRRLVSLPFSYAAGPVFEDEEVRLALLEAARNLAASRKARRLEIKQESAPGPAAPGFVRAEHYHAYRVPMDGGEKALWGRLHAGSTRRSIRKGERDGVLVRHGVDAADWTSLAQLEEATAHRHGVPAPPRRFFVDACRRLQEAGLADLYLATVDGHGIAAGIVLWKGARDWIYAFGASRPELLEYRPNHVLLWAAMKDALAAGVGFDLGRAAPEQSGLVEFKLRWGGQPIALGYDYWPSAGGLNVADRSRGPLAMAAKVWSRVPASMARAGSSLYRYLG
ncbi:MAG: GNAT family N-acetyltransferase [Gemmatimonadota bacterium]